MRKLIETVKNDWPLVLCWAVMTAAYCALSLFRHWHFQSNACDLGIFDQAIWHYSRFEIPACTINGYSNLLGDHFHPSLMLLTPFYWIFPKAETLLVAQAVFLTLPMFPLFFFAQKKIGRKPAYFMALSYSLLSGLQSTAAFDFHEVSLAVTFIAFAIYFMDSQRWFYFFAAIFLLMMTKEDLCLLVVFFGLLFMVRRDFKRGSILTGLGFIFLLFEVKILIPFFGGPGGSYHHWSYGQLGTDPWEALKTCLLRPQLVLGTLLSNGTKIVTLIAVFIPFLFFPLLSSWAFLTIPIICERLLSTDQTFWGPNYQHYSAALCPIVAFAAVDGLHKAFRKLKLPEAREKAAVIFSAIILFLNLTVLPMTHVSKFSILLRPSYYRITDTDRTGYKALKLIPPDASVLAQSSIAPHLTHRPLIRYMSLGTLKNDRPMDYIIACKDLNTWPLEGFPVIQKFLNQAGKKEYRTLFNENNWIVLKRAVPSEKIR